MESMDSEDAETNVRLQYGHGDIIQDNVCSTMPTPREASVYIPAHYCGDNIITQIIKCEDGHPEAVQEDIMCIQQSQIIDVNTGTQNFTVDEQQQDLNDLEYSKSFNNTYNMPTWTCNSSEFIDTDPGEFDGVGGKLRQWIVDEDGLLKEVKTDPTNWINGTDNCTAASGSDLKVHQRRHTGQRLVELSSCMIFWKDIYFTSLKHMKPFH